jgi:hypothetical protein
VSEERGIIILVGLKLLEGGLNGGILGGRLAWGDVRTKDLGIAEGGETGEGGGFDFEFDEDQDPNSIKFTSASGFLSMIAAFIFALKNAFRSFSCSSSIMISSNLQRTITVSLSASLQVVMAGPV